MQIYVMAFTHTTWNQQFVFVQVSDSDNVKLSRLMTFIFISVTEAAMTQVAVVRYLSTWNALVIGCRHHDPLPTSDRSRFYPF